MKQITKIAIVLLLTIAMIGSAGAQEIKVADGSDLPDTVYIGNTFKVLIMENGVPVGAGITVVFTFEGISGITPTTVATDVDGIARYKPYINGVLTIQVLDGVTRVEEDHVEVIDEPWVPQPTPTKKSQSSGGSGGGGFVIPDPTPVNDTMNVTGDVKQTIASVVPTEPAVMETAEEVEDVHQAPEPKPTPESSVPGFGVIFAIAGIFGAVYLLRR